MQFRLEVQGIESVCNFRLSWGNGGEQLVATVPYPSTVILAYEHWQEQYLAFYHNLSIEEPTNVSPTAQNQPLRGKADISGSLAPVEVDWGLQLRHAQETLRSEFQKWLSQGELLPIRRKLSQHQLNQQPNPSAAIAPEPSVVLLSCYSLVLERLPWEDWEIASQFASGQELRFVRSPLDIASPPATKIHRPRLRMLAILGDETGQDFTAEKKALETLEPKIKVQFLNLQNGSYTDIKQRICQTIEDPFGWDILFFAGHSSESSIAGGLVQVAPNQGMMISELLPSLQIAKEKGLHLAIFNSCSGLHIAQSLVSIGISQVVIMREKIHGQIASKFLVELTQKLRQGQDSHTAFLAACDHLNRNSQKYPSAFLVPSLFAHPHATSISLTGWRWRSWFKQMLPGRREAIVLGSCLVLSVIPAVREALLNQRSGVQALYRSLTQQVPPASELPILIVQITQETINKEKSIGQDVIFNQNMNESIISRRYLSRLVNDLTKSGAKVIAIDYLLDFVTGQEQELARSLKDAATKYNTWTFLAQSRNSDKGTLLEPHPTVDPDKLALNGCIDVHSYWHIRLPDITSCNNRSLPHSLAVASILKRNKYEINQLSKNKTFSEKFVNIAMQAKEVKDLQQIRESTIAFISSYSKQFWLQSMTDYSIPPNSVFQTVAAHDFQANPDQFKIQPNQIVIVAAGGYDSKSDDTFPLPKATQYWRARGAGKGYITKITGGEVLAYQTYHFQKRQFLVPVPDLWMILLTGLIGRNIQLMGFKKRWSYWLLSVVGYALLCLQIYVSLQILIPFLLPTTVWTTYVLSSTWRKKNVG